MRSVMGGEAFAEYLHRQARRDWGYGRNEQLDNEEFLRINPKKQQRSL